MTKRAKQNAIVLLARAIEALASGGEEGEAAAAEHIRDALAALGGDAEGDSSRPSWVEVDALVAGALAGERPEALRRVRTAISSIRG